MIGFRRPFTKQQYAETKVHFESALRIAPTLASAHQKLGLLLLRSGNVPETREHLMRATPGEKTRSPAGE